MIKKLYLAARLFGYLACLGGIFYYLYHLQKPGGIPQHGLYFVYVGFIAFFISYGLRAWIRFGPRSKPDPSPSA